jgi:hypothetical protein
MAALDPLRLLKEIMALKEGRDAPVDGLVSGQLRQEEAALEGRGEVGQRAALGLPAVHGGQLLWKGRPIQRRGVEGSRGSVEGGEVTLQEILLVSFLTDSGITIAQFPGVFSKPCWGWAYPRYTRSHSLTVSFWGPNQ